MLYMVTGMGDKTTAVHASVFKSVVVFDFVLCVFVWSRDIGMLF